MAEAKADPIAFEANAVHGLRGPLHVITGFAEALAEDEAAALSEEGRRQLDHILKAAGQLSTRLDGLHALARLAVAPLDPQAVDLGDLAVELVAGLRAHAPGQDVEVDVAPGLRVLADPALVRIALGELLANAWIATRTRALGRVRIMGQRAGAELVASVSDDGVGFAPERATGLFVPFGRAHPTGEWPGLGLGLARVAVIVKRHGGRVWAEAAPDRGATFRLSLPAPAPS
jgi:signal transduction histidine kinase